MNIDFRYFFNVFLRRSPYFIAVVSIFASIGVTVALVLPATYSARATLLVENPQIPSDLAESTVRVEATQQLRIIEQRLLSREQLLDVANRLDLFRDPETGERVMSAAEIVATMRRSVDFVQPSRGTRRRPGTNILHITYESDDPREVAEVTNEFVTLVLEQNVQMRTGQASDTMAFFEQEVDRLSAELDTQSVRLLEFQVQAGVAVPGNVTFLRGRLSSLEDQREARLEEIAALTEQRNRLVELFETTGGLTAQTEQRTALERELDAAREQLFDAQVVFSSTNPKLRVLQARVEQLERRVARESEALSDGEELQRRKNEAQVLFEAQLDDIDTRIAKLEEAADELAGQVEVVSRQISDATSNGFTLAKLERDLEGIRGQYGAARNRMVAAETGERIELLSKGQRISVVEQAVVPRAPISPNRPVIAAAGVGGGAVAGLALIVLMELLNKSIRRPVELTNRLGITPIGVVPYIRTDREMALKRSALVAMVAILVIGVPLLVFAVHNFVSPIDQALARFLGLAGGASDG